MRKKYRAEVYKTSSVLHGTQFRWRLVASNGKKVANPGESYKRKGDLITILKKIGPDWEIVYVD